MEDRADEGLPVQNKNHTGGSAVESIEIFLG
jgi:hypothetical protein